jgi:hypothetical protein
VLVFTGSDRGDVVHTLLGGLVPGDTSRWKTTQSVRTIEKGGPHTSALPDGPQCWHGPRLGLPCLCSTELLKRLNRYDWDSVKTRGI